MRSFLIVFILISLLTNSYSQCPPGDVSLLSQQDVDDFVAMYPNCTDLNGSLTISGIDVSDISGLSNLVSVGCELVIIDCPILPIINFPALTTVKILRFENNSSVNDIYLTGLVTLTGWDQLTIRSNVNLVNLDLSNLTNINSADVRIISCVNLTNLDLSSLVSGANGYLEIWNSGLTNLNLHSLISIDFLHIWENNNLVSIDITNLNTSGYLDIYSNDILTNVSAPALIDGGSVYIWGNNSLTTLNFPLLQTAIHLSFNSNNALVTLDFPSLTAASVFLILANDNLEVINFTSYIDIDVDFNIDDNHKLTTISMPNLNRIDEISIINNPELISINFPSLVTCEKSFRLRGNDNLQEINSLSNLNFVGNNLEIKNNLVLTDCSGVCPVLDANNVFGLVDIVNNPSECSSEQEVLDNCAGATCNITASASNITCNNNGTPSDPSDDTFTFDVLVTGTDNGASWTADDPNNTTGSYDVITTFGPYDISSGNLNFTITDIVDPTCTAAVSVNAPATCSNVCAITSSVTNILCDDNGTPSDPTDDIYTFDLTVTGANTGASWTADDPNNTTGTYGGPISFGPYNISAGNLSFTVTDIDDPTCTSIVNVSPPMTCSNVCVIMATPSNILCNDSGTPSDPSDDSFSFEVVVSGANTGSSWFANDPNSTTGAYNTTVVFGPYNINSGDLNFTITDILDPACTASLLIVAPPTCSNTCDIMSTAWNIVCDDNNTPSDPLDDTFSFDLEVTGANTGASWTANDPNNTTGNYGVTTSFGPYNIIDGNLSFVITDILDPTCTDNVIITAPPSCSVPCEPSNSVCSASTLLSSGLSNSGTTACATSDGNFSCVQDHVVYYNFMTGSNYSSINITLNAIGANNVGMSVWSNCSGTPFSSPNSTEECTDAFDINFSCVEPNTSLIIAVGSSTGDEGSFEITLTESVNFTINNTCSTATDNGTLPTDCSAISIFGTTVNACPNENISTCNIATESTVWHKVNIPSGTVSLEITDISNGIHVSAFQGSCGALITDLSCIDSDSIIPISSSGDYYIAVSTKPGTNAGNYNFNLSAVVPTINDECINGINLNSNGLILLNQSNECSTSDQIPPCFVGNTLNAVWYSYIVVLDVVELEVIITPGSLSNPVIAGYDGCSQFLYNATSESCSGNTLVITDVSAGDVINILVGSAPGDEGNFDIQIIENINPYDIPVAIFTADTQEICIGESVQYTDQSTGLIDSWLWTFEGGTPSSSTEQNPLVTYNTVGNHDVTLEVTNILGQDILSETNYILVEDIPEVAFTYSINGLEVSFTNNSSSANTYLWEFGDGNTATEVNPTHSYADYGTYEIVLYGYNDCGESNATQEIILSLDLTVQFSTIQSTEGCAEYTIDFVDASTGNPTSWNWEFPGGTPSSSTDQNPTITYSSIGTFDVSLNIANDNGTASEQYDNYIIIDDVPNVMASNTINLLTVDFTSTVSNANSVEWNFGDGNTSVDLNPQHTYTDDGIYEVILSAFNDCGVATDTLEINLLGLPTADFSASTNEGCSPLTIEFFDASSANVDSWNWIFEGGTPSSSMEQNPIVTYSSGGTFDVSLTVSNASGSSDITSSDYIIITEQPIADYEYTVDGNQIHLQNNTPNATSEWNISDDITMIYDMDEVTHVFEANGTYFITLTTSNQCGSDEVIFEVEINAYPNSSFDVDLDSGCVPMEILFENNSSLADTYQWEFVGGDPASSTAENPAVNYTSTGIYDVQLISTNSYGSDTLLMPQIISIYAEPIASFTSNIDGSVVDFVNTSMDGVSYQWDFGDGNTSNIENPTHSYLTSGTYDVSLTVLNDCGESQYSESIEVEFSTPGIAVNFSTNEGCAPLGVILTDESTNDPISWNWTFEGGVPASSTDQNPVVVYENAGVYSIVAEISNANGTSTFTFADTITVLEEPISDFEIMQNDPSISLINNSNGADSYTWFFGDGNVSFEENPEHTYAFSGTFPVVLEASNDCGTDVMTQTISVIVSNVEELHSTLGLNLIPNPNNGNFEISLDKFLDRDVDFEIINPVGQMVYKSKMKRGSKNLRINDLASKGIHLIKFQISGQMIVKKVLIF